MMAAASKTPASKQTAESNSYEPAGEQEAGQGAAGQSAGNNLENIRVSVRLRPFTERERQRQSKRIVDIELNTVALYNPKSPEESAKKFTFDYSYWSHDGFKRNQDGLNVPDPEHPNCSKYVSQERVFADLGRFLLENAIEGYNSALLAYGQTGSGKSYTVSGYGQNEGILPRFARELFEELDKRVRWLDGEQSSPAPTAAQTHDAPQGDTDKDNDDGRPPKRHRYEVYFSMIEIYNEVVRDLLAKQNGYASQANGSLVRRGLRVREHPKRGFFVENLSSYPCASKEEIESLIEEGQLNKSIAATSMNETSSRGHTIYEFRIRQFKLKEALARPDVAAAGTSNTQDHHHAPTTPSKATSRAAINRRRSTVVNEVETMTTSVVQLVDLAGSERMTVHLGDMEPARPRSRSSSPFEAGPGEPAKGSKGGQRTRRTVPAPQPTSASSNSSSAATSSLPGRSGQLSSSRRKVARGAATVVGPSASLLGPSLSSATNQQRFKESVSINQSLSALGNCIQVLSQFSQQQQQQNADAAGTLIKQPKIPYRDSVLTKLLNRCCLSGNSKVVLIATLSPADANYDDTLSTLRFADRAKQIRTHAIVNRSVCDPVNVLQRENERLKQILDGRVTRSDDSSQTSNFDDTENMLDNFNGPKVAAGSSHGTPTAPPTSKQQPVAPTTPAGGHQAAQKFERGATVTKAKAAKASSQQATSRKPKNNLRLAQENLHQSHKQHQTAVGAGKTGGKVVGGATAPTTSKIKSSVSNPTLAVGSSQMEQLVSSAEKKMRQKSRADNLDRNGLADHEHEQEESAPDETGQQEPMRRSWSFGLGPADANNGEFEFGSELLDEIDLNELANIVDDEGLLSPDSDDSYNNGANNAAAAHRAKTFDENMSNEEKATILNRLLNNSSVANKIIRRQIESCISGSQTGSKMSRPKKAGAKQHLRPTKRAELANSNALKQSNPYLSNLNPDEQLTGVITYVLDGGGEMVIGKDENSCDLLIYGPGLRGRHARLVRASAAADTEATKAAKGDEDGAATPSAPSSEWYIEPILGDDPPGAPDKTQPPAAKETDGKQPPTTTSQAKRVALLVNGEPVLERTRLKHGDRLLFGSANYFVFVDDKTTGAPPDSVTYDMAHAEVMRKMMSESENEAMIREIKDYTHRPGTGKKRARDSTEPATSGSTAELTRNQDSGGGDSAPTTKQVVKRGSSLEIDQQQSRELDEPQQQQHLENIKEEEGELASGASPNADPEEQYKDKLMSDTYEFAMPIAEANAIASEMGIKVTYGLKILTGEEQLEPFDNIGDEEDERTVDSNDDRLQAQARPESGANEELTTGTTNSSSGSRGEDAMERAAGFGVADDTTTPTGRRQLAAANVVISDREPIKPSTLDIPPELYVHVHLDELQLDFYWSKEKFQERHVKMLELYGAWDVGGKSGLVEYLIEQSKYQGYYVMDPFIDDIKTSWVLVGHAQVTLQPVSHVAGLRESFDVLNVNDEIVGSVLIEAVPCHCDPRPQPAADQQQQPPEWPYKVMDESELANSFLNNPSELLNKRFVFLLRIVSCSNVPLKFAQVLCQYTLNRDRPTIRTGLARRNDGSDAEFTDGRQQQDVATKADGPNNNTFQYDHKNFIVIDSVSQDILDFLRHGFLTIQLVGQYDSNQPDATEPAGSGRPAATEGSLSNPNSAGQQSQRSGRGQQQPTLVSTIISSINKYRFRMEQQSAAYQNMAAIPFQGNGGGSASNNNNFYANSLTDSANSANYRLASSSAMNSNSGPSSVTSASATINLFDQPNDDDEGINSLNGANQENIIDMILTKRKLDRAENQLHYIKRTINIAEHHNKKHVRIE
jgi:hypothetical protein